MGGSTLSPKGLLSATQLCLDPWKGGQGRGDLELGPGGRGHPKSAVLDGRGFLLVNEMSGEIKGVGSSSVPTLLWTLGKVTELSECLSPPVDITTVIRVMLKIKRDDMHKGSDCHLF